jgi:gliding motility-associated-like protein
LDKNRLFLINQNKMVIEMRNRFIGLLLFFLVFIAGIKGQSVCNTFMKKMYFRVDEVVPTGGTRNFSSMTPVATAIAGKLHWYVGHGNSSGGHVDAFAVRTNDTGKVLSWLRFGDKTGAAYRDRVYNVASTPNGGAVVVGSSHVQAVNADLGTIHYFGNNGVLKWSRRTPSSGRSASEDLINSVFVLNGNRFLVVGEGLQLTGKRNMIAALLDSSGNTLWHNNIDMNNTEHHALGAARVGNEWVITGWSRSTSTFPFAVFIRDAGGVRRIWKGTSTGTNSFSDVVVAPGGTIFTVGSTGGTFTGNVLVTAFTANGTRKWSRTVGANASVEQGYTILLDGGSLWVGALSSAAPSRALILQLDTNGGSQLAKFYSNGNTSFAIAANSKFMAKISGGGLTVMGADPTTGPHLNFSVSNPCENLCGISNQTVTNNAANWNWDTSTYTVYSPGDFISITVDTVSVKFSRTVVCESACPLPIKTLKADYLLCTSSPSVTVDATQVLGQSYAWSDGSTSASKVFTTSAAGVVITTTNACGNRKDTINIVSASVPSKPKIKDTTFCGLPISYTVNASVPYANNVWDNGSTLSTRTFTNKGTYWVETKNTCGFRIDTLKLMLIVPPVATKLPDTAFCVGGSVSVNLTKIQPNKYIWSDGDTTVPKQFVSQQQVVLEIANQCGVAYDTFEIVLRMPPTKAPLKDTTFCARPFNWNIDATQPGANTYLWSDGFTTAKRNFMFAFKYYLYTTNKCGSRLDSVTVKFDTLPVPVFADTQFWFCRGDRYVIKGGQPFGSFKYEWNTGAKTPEITVGTSGTFTLRTYNVCGERTDKLRAYAEIGGRCNCNWYMPNAFTPYGSRGRNDVIKPLIYCGVKEGYWSVYDRWGACLFENRPLNEAWDGNYMGELVPEGIYIYSIHAIFDETVQGFRNLDTHGTFMLISGKKD